MDSYKEFLSNELELVQGYFDEAFTVEGDLMSEVADYLKQGQGKMLRPAIVCLSAMACGYDGRGGHHARLGAAIELFHLATLLHDDVVDHADLRRGRPTVNARWGDDVAILFADYLYATSFDYSLAVLDPEIVRILSKTTQTMTEGEIFQIERREDWLSVPDYYKIIRAKTACLFSAAGGLGAVLAGAAEERVQQMFEFGMRFGMAFQITDDALDYEAQGGAWGKRVGADLKEGKQTLPLLYTLQQAGEEDREALLHTLRNGRDFETVHHYVKLYNGIDYSLEKAGEFAHAASGILDSLEDGEAVEQLRRISEHVLARQY